eukprot:TRINITY_DN7995_c0_g1_i2.p1 TRINITY_DN7995_c0_g1~~TRINITY_DN7995_c0_g1_i2.p1  ORF type:complete len:425 (+),score=59.10 TRINITY_DN7995_c0_g1_i2:423-1697(+)
MVLHIFAAVMPSFASVVARCAVPPMTTDEKASAAQNVAMEPSAPVVPHKVVKAAPVEAPHPTEPSFEESQSLLELAKDRLASLSTSDMITGVGLLVDQLALQTQALPVFATKFDAPSPMPVSITDFLGRIIASRLCSRECCVLALVYGRRLLAAYPKLVLTNLNMHRIFLIAMMLASKLIDDRYCRNNYYATMGGMDVDYLNRLEMEFCFLLGFNLHVTHEEFASVCDAFVAQLRARAAARIAPARPVFAAPSPVLRPHTLLSPHLIPPPLLPSDTSQNFFEANVWSYAPLQSYTSRDDVHPYEAMAKARSLGWGPVERPASAEHIHGFSQQSLMPPLHNDPAVIGVQHTGTGHAVDFVDQPLQSSNTAAFHPQHHTTSYGYTAPQPGYGYARMPPVPPPSYPPQTAIWMPQPSTAQAMWPLAA